MITNSLARSRDIEKALSVLIGRRLLRVVMVGAFRMFAFTSKLPKEFDYEEVGDWALHVDCVWRLEQSGRIITGSEDWFMHEVEELPPDNWTPEAGSSLEEAAWRKVLGDTNGKGSFIYNRTSYFIVESVAGGQCGDARVCMSPAFTLAIFPAGTREEAWRLFRPGDDNSHFVIH